MFLNRNRLSVHGGDHKSRNEFSSKLIPLIISKKRMFGEKKKKKTKKRPRMEEKKGVFLNLY